MSRDQLSRRCRRLLERLSQPSSAAGLAALLALLCRSSPSMRRRSSTGLTVIAIGAAIVRWSSASAGTATVDDDAPRPPG